MATKIKETLVEPYNGFLDKHLKDNNLSFYFQDYLYKLANECLEDYCGGQWEFVELSNGGFYWYLDEEDCVLTSMNGWSDTISGKAAGLGLTICVLNHAMWQFQENDEVLKILYTKYNKALQYSRGIPEAVKLICFLD